MWISWRRQLAVVRSSSIINNYVLNDQIKRCGSAIEIERLLLAPPQEQPRYNAINCATALRVLARTNSRSKPALDQLLKRCELRFPPQALSNSCHAIASGRLLPALPTVFVKQLVSSPTTRAAANYFAEYNAQDLANLAWALAKMNDTKAAPVVFPRLQKEICAREELVRSATPQALANLLWAFATLRTTSSSQEACAVICREIESRDLSTFTNQELANPLWALAVLQFDKTLPLGKAIAQEFATNREPIRSFAPGKTTKPQDVANTVWALATLTQLQPCAFYGVSRAVCNKVCDEVDSFAAFRPQELSSTLWGFATLQQHAPPEDAPARFPVGIARQICDEKHHQQHHRGLEVYSPQALSNLVWAMASLKNLDSLAFLRLSQELERPGRKLSEFTPEALCITLWSFATASMQFSLSTGLEPEFYTKLFTRVCLEVAKRELGTFTSHDLTQLSWAMFTTRFVLPELTNKLYRELDRHRNLKEFSLKQLASIIVVLAQMNTAMEDDGMRRLVSGIANQVRLRGGAEPDSWDSHSLMPVLWSLACLDVLRLPEVEALFQARAPPAQLAPPPAGREQGSNATALQLLQVQLAWDQVHGPSNPSRMLQELANHVRQQQQHHPVPQRSAVITSSQVHLDIMHELRHYAHLTDIQSEVKLMKGGLFAVDMYIPSKRAVIEVDGPVHYLSDGKSLNGSTLFKKRLLRRAGYRVFTISVSSYTMLAKEDRVAYCQRLAREINEGE